MYYDEAVLALRMDATFGLPVRRSITRDTGSWAGRWLEWHRGQLTECYDGDLRREFGDITTHDLSAKDWIVEESR